MRVCRGAAVLENTFCHIPGIGVGTERRLWGSGLYCWADVNDAEPGLLPARRAGILLKYSRESTLNLTRQDARYFYHLLPSNQHWRLFREFRDSLAYLDIETTGLDGRRHDVTTIALYDGEDIYHYVRGQNLPDFARDIERYDLIVTYNGKTFDVPFLRRHLRLPMDQAHIDLRYVLAGLGYTGGLKACEKRFGLARQELADVDGFFAVLLWFDYCRNGNPKALDTLLAYNIMDVVNLAHLMTAAYNMKIGETPFASSHALPMPACPDIPFEADSGTIERIKRQHGW